MAGEGDEGVAVIISQAHESQRRREAIMNTVTVLIALHRRSNNDNLHVQLEIMIHELLEIALLFYTDAPADDDHDEDDDGPDSDSDSSGVDASVARDPPNPVYCDGDESFSD